MTQLHQSSMPSYGHAPNQHACDQPSSLCMQQPRQSHPCLRPATHALPTYESTAAPAQQLAHLHRPCCMPSSTCSTPKPNNHACPTNIPPMLLIPAPSSLPHANHSQQPYAAPTLTPAQAIPSQGHPCRPCQAYCQLTCTPCCPRLLGW